MLYHVGGAYATSKGFSRLNSQMDPSGKISPRCVIVSILEHSLTNIIYRIRYVSLCCEMRSEGTRRVFVSSVVSEHTSN